MARVLMPTMPRSYNHNPRGSSTATVVMKGDNPFERRTIMTNSRLAGGALPGMSGLGDAAPAPAPAAAATDWTGVAAALAQAGVQIGGQAIAAHYAPNQPLSTPVIQQLQAINPNAQRPQQSSVLPWALGGGALVLGLGVLYLMVRTRK